MYPLSLDFTELKGEKTKVYAWNSSRKMLPFKAWVVSTDNAEKLLKIRFCKKGFQSYCPHTLKSHKFIEPDEAGPVYLVDI